MKEVDETKYAGLLQQCHAMYPSQGPDEQAHGAGQAVAGAAEQEEEHKETVKEATAKQSNTNKASNLILVRVQSSENNDGSGEKS